MAPNDGNLLLIVDDNETALYAKARILRRAGFEIVEAQRGADAIALVRERMPKLVILDVKLPDIDGWEVCRRIKSDPATASVVVLQTSATYVSEADTVRALEGGADACLTEPVEPPVLIATVRALLRARQAEEALREALAREQAARSTAEAANRTKDEFLATLSHELRSPLGTILTWVSLLRAGRLDEARTARALESIERNTLAQSKLIDDLLDVSRIASGKMRMETRLVDLRSVVDATLDSVRQAADAKGIHVSATTDPTLGLIMGDPARLQQVTWNLLSNAVKFTPKGGKVSISCAPAQSEATIVVTDTGRGIAPEFLPHIFERFRQVDSSSTRAEGGLGLGLAIVRHLVELHGGTVDVTSEGVGKGSTFTVRLPFPAFVTERSDSDPSVEAMAFGPGELPRLDGVRILAVDDDAEARESIGAVLTHCGADVRTASSVREAVASITASRPDVVVSDIGMPHEDGYALPSAVRALGSERTAIPLLALTAYAGAGDRERILAAGFDAFLGKPIEAAKLASAVARLVPRS